MACRSSPLTQTPTLLTQTLTLLTETPPANRAIVASRVILLLPLRVSEVLRRKSIGILHSHHRRDYYSPVFDARAVAVA